jgi:anti-sigma B factor antagonist
MKMVEEEKGSVVVIRMNGKLLGGSEAETFQKQMKDYVTQGRNNILIDLSKVSWVNSSGLGMLIAAYHTVKSAGGTFKLTGVNQRIEQIFMVTKLHTIFDTYEEEAAALASF